VLRPEADLRFTAAGGYARLLEHIAVHRYYLGEDWQREVSEDEAVEHWYDHVYTPLVRVVREQGILAEFPARTETDLYLWVMDHRYYLRETFGEDAVDTAEAAGDYAEHYSERPVARVVHAARHAVQSLLGPVIGAGDDEEEQHATDDD
jgi:hypothetical protein